jgi:DNA (cytosine-5)-methyltransferase 1
MKFGSVCSGIEAASVAWEPLGWEAQWFSEIEHFPSAVLNHRFPTVPNLGDMTKIHETEIFNGKTIDLLVGGTPCQSFSVAGLRKGLTDPRGNLMLTFLSLAQRKKPRWIVWENVPGVLSSNGGRDFATFLTALGDIGYGFAYRVLDAQYIGGPRAVPQRRRRVFVIGFLGDWRPCASVLFESESLSGDSKKSREKRKATSSDAQGGSGSGGFRMTAFGEYADDNTALTLKQRDYKDATDLVAQTFSVPAIGSIIEDKVSSCITRHTGAGAGETQNPSYVLEPKAHAFKVKGGSEVETGEQGGTPGKKAGKGYLGQDEKVFTIGTTQDQQIAQPLAVDYYNHTVNEDVCQTVTSRINASLTGGVLQPTMAIRRLTPKECERLQGFPDDWTLIPYRNKSADQCPDGPRYKACGNSMAVPVMRWIGERIQMVEGLLSES